MSRCDIYLENYRNHYISGDTIVGHVLCTFVKPQKVHGITLTLKGVANTEWPETQSHYDHVQKRSNTRIIRYYGSQTLLDHKINLLPDGTPDVLPKGVYKYAFKYLLPQRLPSTFSKERGEIKYTIRAVVKCPFLEFNYEARSPIVVITPVDLNLQPSLRNPIVKTAQKETYFLFWNKGNISAKASVPRSGFVIGEPFPLSISVKNMSQSSIEHILCSVTKKLTLKTTSPAKRIKEDSDVIFKDQYSGVGANGHNTFEKNIIITETSLVSDFIDCGIININYHVDIIFEISGMHTNIGLQIPVTVGHIPFVTHEMGPPPPYPGFDSLMEQPSLPTVSSSDLHHRQPAYNPDVVGPPLYPTLGQYSEMSVSNKSNPLKPMTSKPGNEDEDDWELVDSD